jgi:hypothetical protein
MKQSRITITKQVPAIGAVEFTGHFIGGNLENISWHVLLYSTEGNGKIAEVADTISAEEFETVNA